MVNLHVIFQIESDLGFSNDKRRKCPDKFILLYISKFSHLYPSPIGNYAYDGRPQEA